MKRVLFFLIVFSLLGFQSLWAGHWSSSSSSSRTRTTTVLLCPSCHFQNACNASYCSRCGALLSAEAGGIPCSFCSFANPPGATFCGGCGRNLTAVQEVYVVCPHCHKKYQASQSGCPSCAGENHGQTTRIYTPVLTTPVLTTPVVTTTTLSPPVRVRTHAPGCVLLETFHKDDFTKVRKEYDVSGYTNNGSFSRLIVDVKVNEKFAVILNTVHVRVKGRWQETTIGSRLNEGRNEFSVSVPEGATGVVCSFTHGRGSDVSVSLEN